MLVARCSVELIEFSLLVAVIWIYKDLFIILMLVLLLGVCTLTAQAQVIAEPSKKEVKKLIELSKNLSDFFCSFKIS